MDESIACPVCLHEETVRARIEGRAPVYDDPPLMRYRRAWSRGPAILARWDRGSWTCGACLAHLSPRDAGVMLDAALMHIDPDCDSIVDGLHEDARRAFRGGSDG